MKSDAIMNLVECMLLNPRPGDARIAAYLSRLATVVVYLEHHEAAAKRMGETEPRLVPITGIRALLGDE